MKRVIIAGFILIFGCGEESQRILLHLKPLSSDVNINSADFLNVNILMDSDTKNFSYPLTGGNSFEFKGNFEGEISISIEGMKDFDPIFFGLSAPFYPSEVKEKVYIPVFIPEEFVRIPDFQGLSPLTSCGRRNGFAFVTLNGVFSVDLLSFRMEKIFEGIDKEVYGCAWTSEGLLIGERGKVLFINEGGYKEYELGELQKFAIFSTDEYAVICGGISYSKKTAESYIFKDGNLRKWKSMNSPKAGHIAIPLGNGDFMIAGGGGEPELWRKGNMDFEEFSSTQPLGDVSAGVFVDGKIFLIRKETGDLLEVGISDGKVNPSGISFNGVRGAGDGKSGMIVNNDGEVLILPSLKEVQIKDIEPPAELYATRGIYIILSKRGFNIYMKKEVLK